MLKNSVLRFFGASFAKKSRFLAGVAVPSLLAGLLVGCATPPSQSDTADYQAYIQQNDPLEPTNRVFYSVNDKIDRYALKPVAEGYVHITTQPIRNHVSDFVTNISEPGRLIYFMFGGKPRDAGTSLVRFLVDSTIGIGGIFDPATALGYPETDTDFGLTLAEWGVPAGPYLYLPVFGPSGARDVLYLPAAYFLTPIEAAPSSTALTVFSYSETGLRLVNTRAEYIDPIDQIEATALDPYATFRSLYRQQRASQLQLIDQRDTPTVPDWYPQPAQK
ncbi:MAG: VacJ family lipoprotein [Acidocella sp.]|nr:VacJ family lipoprotein [Acidocella sp.]